jgi:hypothetical protein
MPDEPGRLSPEAFAVLATKLRLKTLLSLLTARADAGFPRKYALALDLLNSSTQCRKCGGTICSRNRYEFLLGALSLLRGLI